MKKTSLIWLLVALAALGGAGALNRDLRDERRARGLTQADPLENAPPMVAFTTVALGGFRGMLADWLWLRASSLQEEGRYFELVQLSDWITKLEPRLTPVWAFHGWNLAYNISVLFDDPADRWRWVSHGIRLLRDEGLVYNPDDAKLLYELGWLFQHKLGMNLDQAHGFYKQAWAAEMAALFDGPAPDFAAYAAALDAPASAPPDLLRRARRLRDEYHLDPRLMQQVDERHGPLDWRLPQAHAIYWATRSAAVATGFSAVQAERMISQAMAQAFREGRLFVSEDGAIFVPSPNLELVPRVRREFEDALKEHPDVTTFPTAHRNFLIEATMALYLANRRDEARDVFDDLARRYPGADTKDGLEPFVYRTFATDLKDMNDFDAQNYVEGLFGQALFWEAIGDAGRAAGYDQLARLCWRSFMAARTDPEFRDRTGLPPIPRLRELALKKLKEQWPDRPGVQRMKITPEAEPKKPEQAK